MAITALLLIALLGPGGASAHDRAAVASDPAAPIAHHACLLDPAGRPAHHLGDSCLEASAFAEEEDSGDGEDLECAILMVPAQDANRLCDQVARLRSDRGLFRAPPRSPLLRC